MMLRRHFVGLVLSAIAAAQSLEPPPQMQSVGVRGAVDGAGYSAPAAARAQSNITQLLLKLQFEALQQTMRKGNCSGCGAQARQGFEAELNQQFEGAAEHFHAALSCSQTVDNRFAYGIAQLLLNKQDAAHRAFADIQNADSSLGSTGLALLLYQQGDWTAALNEALGITEQHEPASLASLVVLTIVSNPAVQLPPNVRTRLSRLSALAPENAALLSAEATIEFREHDAQAVPLLERAVKLDPTIAEAHILLGEVYTDRQEFDRAIEQYRAALSAHNGDAGLHYRLGQVYLLSGKRDLGEAELNAYRSIREASPETLSSDIRSLLSMDIAKACAASGR